MVDVPHFAELAATKVFEEVKRNPRFQTYLPEIDTLKRPMNRQYLFNVRAVSQVTLLPIDREHSGPPLLRGKYPVRLRIAKDPPHGQERWAARDGL